LIGYLPPQEVFPERYEFRIRILGLPSESADSGDNPGPLMFSVSIRGRARARAAAPNLREISEDLIRGPEQALAIDGRRRDARRQ
jgi:hypothetical protein